MPYGMIQQIMQIEICIAVAFITSPNLLLFMIKYLIFFISVIKESGGTV
jgi:hypothetical protein